MEPQLAEREKKEEEVRELLALAEKLEGLTRNVGMHAGGVLIAPGKLTDFCPVYAADGSGSVVSQFDMKDVEAVGLVKFDFLGLTTLTILDWTLGYIKAEGGRRKAEGSEREGGRTHHRHPHPSSLDLNSLPLDDAETYRMFANADTTGIFQFESRGMRDLLTRAKPDRFEDLVALVALYRPGPMELIPEFVKRKHGGRVDYPDPRVEPILKPTYGIMVYQEQVMQIAQVIGAYSLGGADLLRRAMGKKLPEEMAQHREHLRPGRREEQRQRAQGERALRPDGEVRGLRLQPLARSRLRAGRLPDGVLQGASCRGVHRRQHVGGDERYRQGASSSSRTRARTASRVLPPDVNQSNFRFEPVPPGVADAGNKGGIRYGLGGIKGTGEARHRQHRRGAARAAVHGSLRFLPPRGQAPREPARRRVADPRGRVRRAGRPPRAACSPRSASRSKARSRRAAPPTR